VPASLVVILIRGGASVRICNLRYVAVVPCDFEALFALADPWIGGALSGITRLDVALTRSGLGGPTVDLRRSSGPAFPRGRQPSGQLESVTAGEEELTASQASYKVPSRRGGGRSARRAPFAAHAVSRSRAPGLQREALARVRIEFAAS
jgi:hypothetical protein